MKTHKPTPDRVGVSVACRMTGYKTRQLQNMAPKIPGAAQLTEGGKWSFNLKKLSRWIEEREGIAKCRIQTSTKEAGSTTGAKRPRPAISDEAYERALRS